MRRALVLLLLYLGIQLVLPLRAGPQDSAALMTLGFLILAAYTVGEMAASARLPKIVGYLIAGIVFGPSATGIVSAETAHALEPINTLAVALIAFLAGAELRWSVLRERGTAMLKILSVELVLGFVAIAALMIAAREHVPFLRAAGTPQVVAFSVLFAAIAIVHSPAVTMALLTETGAKGPVASTTLGVVLVSDVVIVLFFSGALALARVLVPPTGSDVAAVTLPAVLWEVGGAVVIGAALGGAAALYLRFARRELFLFAILITFAGAALARVVHVESLLMLLTAGFVAENVSQPEDGVALRTSMERAAAPFFVVFFALAGAALALADLAALWPLVVALVLVRAAAIWSGVALGARWARVSVVERRNVWLGLVSQAGVAVGFATIVAQVYPQRGGEIRTLFLAALAINQLAGPMLFRFALSRSGELDAAREPAPDAERAEV